MTIHTTEPGIQLYLGQGLNTRGKSGARYAPHAGVALETQHFPNSPNEPAFPTTLLLPGKPFASRTSYRFGDGEDL
jgi:aldose 1-epimerase